MFETITESLNRVFSRLRGRGRLSEARIEEAMREIRIALLEADVAHGVARDFLARVSEKAVGEAVVKSVRPGEMVVKLVHDELVSLLGGEAAELVFATEGPSVMMLCGLQGSGKTTTVGKLATRLLAEGHRPLLVAADVQRPAAIEQLRILGAEVGAPVYAEEAGDPVAISSRALEVAALRQADTVLLDTAGRLHVDEPLMLELEAIVRATAPVEVLLVLDAMTGQDAVHSAETFARRLPLTGAILTKMEGDARGGAALSLRAATGVPIKFVGVGEKLDALEPFHPERVAGRILGMGDIVSFVEKAQEAVDEEEQSRLQQRLLRNEFTLEDFQKQLAQLRKMGPIKDLLGMIPGLGAQFRGADVDEGELQRVDALLSSMTRDERAQPERIDVSRRERIARGSGTSAVEVSRLLKQFRTMKKMMGKLRRRGLLGGLLGGSLPSFETLSPGGAPPWGHVGTKAQQQRKKDRRKEKKKKRRR
ncbi:MAG: signal recognition particle protein [Planctomycetota bacterium]